MIAPDPRDPLLAAYRDAYREGRAAYRAGRYASECPYTRNRRMAELWLHGWEDEREAVAIAEQAQMTPSEDERICGACERPIAAAEAWQGVPGNMAHADARDCAASNEYRGRAA